MILILSKEIFVLKYIKPKDLEDVIISLIKGIKVQQSPKKKILVFCFKLYDL